MASERAQRRLAAILAADMVGYSRLMEADERGTIARQKAHRSELIDPAIAEHGGRIVKTTGDGLLVEFASVVDATECAVAIQQTMPRRELAVPNERRIHYRIGINLGDIVIDEDDILGDGVNVAARLEGLADPGGVCIAQSAYDQVAGKLDLSVEDMGETEIKNIARKVRAYRIVFVGAEEAAAAAASEDAVAPSKPSIAVLAFDNMSGDADQEFFADGIAEDIITELSRFREFVVIARNSSFTYKGRAVDLKQVARELGVRYVLEGSVRKAGNRVRITAQLIDAPTGQHVWADRYDRDIEDIFAVQDEITVAIIGEIAPGVISAEVTRTQGKQTTELDAWQRTMRARWLIRRFTKEAVNEGIALLEELVAEEPDNVMVLTDLAFALHFAAAFGWMENVEAARERRAEVARRAVAADDQDAAAHTARAIDELFAGQHDEAARRLERALQLNPNSSFALGYLGAVNAFGGNAEAALHWLRRAQRLSPRDLLMVVWHTASGWAHLNAEQFEEAAAAAGRAIEWNPDFLDSYAVLASALGHLGRTDEAAPAIEQLRARLPDLTLGDPRLERPFRREEDRARFLEGLRLAGLPAS